MEASPRKRTYFGTVDVYDEDMASLNPGQLIRSNILAYFFARLQKQDEDEGGGVAGPQTRRRRLFLDASVAQCMYSFGSFDVGPVRDFLAADTWIIPIHSDYSTQSLAGTAASGHWSLLVVRVSIRTKVAARASSRVQEPMSIFSSVAAADHHQSSSFVPLEIIVESCHLDSFRNSNRSAAQRFLSLVTDGIFGHGGERLLGRLGDFQASSLPASWAADIIANADLESRGSPLPFNLTIGPLLCPDSAPQQMNGYDCGMFVCCAASALQQGGGNPAGGPPSPDVLNFDDLILRSGGSSESSVASTGTVVAGYDGDSPIPSPVSVRWPYDQTAASALRETLVVE